MQGFRGLNAEREWERTLRDQTEKREATKVFVAGS